MSLEPPLDDIAPAIGSASRGVIAAMMAGVAARGFEGMTPAFASLIPLLDATGARPTTLAARAGITKQAISQLVRELEKRGYVEQAADSSDTRAKIVRLTPRGVALRAACFAVRQEMQAAAGAALGPARMARFRKDLAELMAAIAALRAPAGGARAARAAVSRPAGRR
ncbi:MAG TPA: MarR family transcriptional regulator [Caulobacteraceae bacterium]|nr:MarR family transcriptional regulator [Caulobacteraceae bacterium]